MKNFVDKIQQFYFFQVIFQRIRKVIINVIVFAFIFVVQFGPIVFVAKNDFSNFSLEFKNRRIFFGIYTNWKILTLFSKFQMSC